MPNRKRCEDCSAHSFMTLRFIPPLEKVPPKYAISERNKWMVSEADLIIAYVKYARGGAYSGLQYARRRGKRIINLADDLKED